MPSAAVSASLFSPFFGPILYPTGTAAQPFLLPSAAQHAVAAGVLIWLLVFCTWLAPGSVLFPFIVSCAYAFISLLAFSAH
jgi:hypothetical protein